MNAIVTQSLVPSQGRLLNEIETLLANYLDDERAACALAPCVKLPVEASGTTDTEIENAIAEVLCQAYCASGQTTVLVEYVCGQRRDTLRRL